MAQEEMASRGGLDWIFHWFLQWMGCQALEQAAQDSGGVTNLVDVALGTWFSGGLGRVYIWTQRS